MATNVTVRPPTSIRSSGRSRLQFGVRFRQKRRGKRSLTKEEKLEQSRKAERTEARKADLRDRQEARRAGLIGTGLTSRQQVTKEQLDAVGGAGKKKETIGDRKARKIRGQTAAERARQARSATIRGGRQEQRERMQRTPGGRRVPRTSIQLKKGGERLVFKGGATGFLTPGTRLTPQEAENKRKFLEGGARLRNADEPRQAAAKAERAQKRARRPGHTGRAVTQAEIDAALDRGVVIKPGTIVSFGAAGSAEIKEEVSRRLVNTPQGAARAGARDFIAKRGSKESVEGSGALDAALGRGAPPTPSPPADPAAAGPGAVQRQLSPQDLVAQGQATNAEGRVPLPGQQTTTPSFTGPAAGPAPASPLSEEDQQFVTNIRQALGQFANDPNPAQARQEVLNSLSPENAARFQRLEAQLGGQPPVTVAPQPPQTIGGAAGTAGAPGTLGPAGTPAPLATPAPIGGITDVQRADIASQLQQTPVIQQEGGLGDVSAADRALVEEVQAAFSQIPNGLSPEERQVQRQAVFARFGPERTAKFNQIAETIAGRTSAATTGGFNLPLAGGPPVQIPFATDEGALERRIGDRGLALRAQGLPAEQITQILRTEFGNEAAPFPGITARLSQTGALPGTPAVPGTATTPAIPAQSPIAPTIPFSGAPSFSSTQRPEQFAPPAPVGGAGNVIVPAAGPTPTQAANIALTNAQAAGRLIANKRLSGAISEHAATSAQAAVQTQFTGDVEPGIFGGSDAIVNETARVAGAFRANMIGANLSAADKAVIAQSIQSSPAWTKLQTIVRNNNVPGAVTIAQKIINDVLAFSGGAPPASVGTSPAGTPPSATGTGGLATPGSVIGNILTVPSPEQVSAAATRRREQERKDRAAPAGQRKRSPFVGGSPFIAPNTLGIGR